MRHGQVRVEVRPVHAPDGSARVLLQLEHGFVLLRPVDARHVADFLVAMADEADDEQEVKP